MKHLHDSGCNSKIEYGVKVLSTGADKLKALGIPITLEVSDASKLAIEAIKATGGSI